MDAYDFLLQSGAVSAISLTVTRSELFKPLRKFKLFKCPYCFSHWVALDFTYHFRWGHRDFIVYWFALVAAAALISGAIMRLNLSQETRIAELESDLDEALDLLKRLDTGVRR